MYFGGNSMEGICLSPDGKTVTYISDYDDKDDEFNGYIKVGSRAPDRIGKNMAAVAVSNGGKHLYYARVSDDGRTVFLEIPEIRPTWCMEITYAIRGESGEAVEGDIHNTIHQLR